MKSNRLLTFLFFIVSICWCAYASAESLHIPVNRDLGHIGKYLLGMHFVYSHEKDKIYRDDSIAKWAKKAGVRVARYPGGTVIQYWDWKNPTGLLNVDSWDPTDNSRADPSEWMSMDEYLHFVDVSGVKPLIGINILSGVRYGKLEESIKRAAEEVQYVVAKGHTGAFYYLGNEDIGLMGGIEEAAKIFVRHAIAIKKVDPSAKLFWNDNYVNPKRLARFLSIAGGYADGVEFHGKWPFGGRKHSAGITVRDWQEQYPIREEERGIYSERAAELREAARRLGFPNLMLADNEYGLSPFGKDHYPGFNRFDYSLVVLEQLQDLFVGQFDMTAFWSNVTADNQSGEDKEGKRLIDTENGNRLNPMHFGFEMLSSAQGKKLAKINGGSPGGYGFAAIDDGIIEIFLLNKTDSNNNVDIEVEGVKTLQNTGTMTSLVDTSDHWGSLVENPVSLNGSKFSIVLPALSYSKIMLRVK